MDEKKIFRLVTSALGIVLAILLVCLYAAGLREQAQGLSLAGAFLLLGILIFEDAKGWRKL